jgi:DNA primase
MARYGDDTIEEIRARADLVELIGAHVRLRRAGRNFVGLCPFHNEKTPSFSVNTERGFFHCFGCGAGGTAFNFLMRMEGLTFPEAVESLARRYGVTLPAFGGQGRPPHGERDLLARANEVAAEFFAHVLWNTENGAPARDYLKRRGVALETARTFKLGFAPARPASLAKALEKRGLRDAAVKLGLVRADGDDVHDLFRARLMFPIRDAQGRVLAFGGRVLDARLPKYINSPESPLYSKARTLYGLYESRRAIAEKERAIVVEGYLDAIALWQAGFQEVVAGCGTALTVEQLRLLARYTKNVLACFDGDEAGRKASLRALEVFLDAGLLGRAIFIPSGFDPDTFVRDRGAQAFAELIDRAELLIDYFLASHATAAKQPDDVRARAAASVAEMLRRVKDPFQFDLLARKAASLLGVGEEVLRRQGRASRPPARGYSPAPSAEKPAAPQPPGDGATRAEIGLIALALFRPELRAELSAADIAALFDDGALAATLADLGASDEPHGALEGWLAARLSPGQISRIGEIAVGSMIDEPDRARAFAADLVAALRRRRQARRVQSLTRAAREAAGAGSDEAAAKAQEVIMLRREASERSR